MKLYMKILVVVVVVECWVKCCVDNFHGVMVYAAIFMNRINDK